jgi:hypothetical protein
MLKICEAEIYFTRLFLAVSTFSISFLTDASDLLRKVFG